MGVLVARVFVRETSLPAKVVSGSWDKRIDVGEAVHAATLALVAVTALEVIITVAGVGPLLHGGRETMALWAHKRAPQPSEAKSLQGGMPPFD
jgi:hypothetical protein